MSKITVPPLPKDPGPAGWNVLLPDAAPPRVLEERRTADWLIVGAGFAGLAAAKRLSQLRPEDSIVVLEARRVAEGPAGRNSGFMIDLPHDLTSEDYAGGLEADRAQTAANRAAIDFAQANAEEAGLSDEAFSRCGKINGAASDKGHAHNLDYSQHLAHLGEAFELLDAQAMEELTGTSYYRSGLFTPGSAMIQPALFVRGLAQALSSNRVTLFENSPVRSMARQGDAWVVSTQGDGHVTAPKVILAVNGLINDFGFFKNRLMHVFTYASMTREMTDAEVARLGGAPIWHLTPADPMGTTVRKISGQGGHRLIIRNRFSFDASKEVPDARFDNIARDHDRCFLDRFPMLEGVAMEHRWGGRLCLSPNNVGAFGEVDEGLYSACCQNGLGVAKGTLLGMAAAEQAAGHSSSYLSYLLAEQPPSKVPGGPFASLGANAVIKWNEFRAGREF